MALTINRNYLSFEILDTGNPQTLVFLDTSKYYKNPDTPLLELVPPGHNKYFLVNIAARKVNTLNSGTIGLSDVLDTGCLVDLPDGVWTFKYKICPYESAFVSAYHLRTVKLEQSLSEIFSFLDFSDCDVAEDAKLKKSIVDIMLAIASGKAHAKSGDTKKASDLYKISVDLVNEVLDKLSKTCV